VTDPFTDPHTTADLLVQITDLQRKLATMPQIEQAKGALMLVYGLTDNEAFDLLRRYSQNSNTKLRDLAAALTAQYQRKPLGNQAQHQLTQLLQATIADQIDPPN
jgi:hypothetical protein